MHGIRNIADYDFSSERHYLVSHDNINLGGFDIGQAAANRLINTADELQVDGTVKTKVTVYTVLPGQLPKGKVNVFANTPNSGRNYIAVTALAPLSNSTDVTPPMGNDDISFIDGTPMHFMDNTPIGWMGSFNPPSD